MNINVLELLIFAPIAIGALAVVALKRPASGGAAARLSGLSAAAFFCALLALAVALAAALTFELSRKGDLLDLRTYDLRALRMASEILRFCVLLPSLGAVAFGLAGRGAIRESRGSLRGKALYRSAILLALLAGGGSWAALS